VRSYNLQLKFNEEFGTIKPMFVRVKKSKNSPRKSVQIVASVREKDKIKQKTVRYIGVALDDKELELLMQLAETIKTKMEHEAAPQLFSPDELSELNQKSDLAAKIVLANQDGKNFEVDLRDLKEESRVIEGIHEVYGKLYEQMRLDGLFNSRQKRAEAIFKDLVLARIAQPKSKLATSELLQRSFGQRLDVNAVYRTMDHIDDAFIDQLQERVYRETSMLFGNKLDVVFFDATTLYYESFEEDEFRKNGYSKDMKFNQPQVLMALLVTREGLPVGYEVFPGNQYEGHTLIPCLTKLQTKYGVNRVIFVADSGMYNRANIEALEANGFEYIVGARIKSQSQEIKKKALDPEGYVAINENERIKEIAINGDRVIVDFSALRARKNRSDRTKSIEKLRKKLTDKKKIGSKDLLSNYGYKKYLKEAEVGSLVLDEEKIVQDEAWDGLMAVKTNNKTLQPLALVRQYQQLWIVEEAFRINKHTLQMRPIFHFKQSRIKAHIAICFTAFSLMAHLRYRVKIQQVEMSLDDIREELMSVQASILFNKKNGFRYYLPSSISLEAQKIYKVLNLSRYQTPKIISA
jgi:transposase